MTITCPKCNFSRSVDPVKVPDRAVRVNCPKCGEEFTFDKSQHTIEPHEHEAPAEQLSCPACGLEQPKTESCRGCGVVFSKLQAIQKENGYGKEADPMNGTLADLRRMAERSLPEDQPKAGFWIRVVAYLIDGLLLWSVQFVLGLLISLIINMLGLPAEGNSSIDAVLWLFEATLSLGYAVFFIGYCGQTPGKMALRIKVIRTDGGPVSYGRAVLREVLGKFVSGILLGIGYLMVAFDSQKQGLHDKMADTYVIKL
jgi:predicted Zn finger-like uncharacterized protein